MELHVLLFFVFCISYVVIVFCAEIVIFSKADWSFSKEEVKRQLSDAKKNIKIFSLVTIAIPLSLIPIDIILKKDIPLITYVVVFFSLSFALALSTQIHRFLKLKALKIDLVDNE